MIVAQIAITVAILPMAINKSHQTIRMALQPAGFPTSEYLSTDFSVDRDADVVDAHADSVAADSAKAIIKAFTARMEVEPGVAGVTVSSWLPWQSSGGTMEAEGSREAAQSIRASNVDDRYFDVFGMRVSRRPEVHDRGRCARAK